MRAGAWAVLTSPLWLALLVVVLAGCSDDRDCVEKHPDDVEAAMRCWENGG